MLGLSIDADVARGSLTLHFGRNDMWGLRWYDRLKYSAFQSDSTFPRRLAIGGLTISAAKLAGARFHALQFLDNATVVASLNAPDNQTSVRVEVVLSPTENIAVTRIAVAASAPLELNVTSFAAPLLPYKAAADQPGAKPATCKPNEPDPGVLGCLDGHTSAAVDAARRMLWAVRTPLNASSNTNAVTVAAASAFAPGVVCKLSTDSMLSASCIAAVSGTVTVASAVISNFELEASGTPSLQPMQAAAAKAAAAAASVASAERVREQSNAWWKQFWDEASVNIPGMPWLEEFYYAQTYMIASASRENTSGPFPAGLWGPWVFSDEPGWGGDFTLDYNHEANHWGLPANNRLGIAWPQFAPIISYLPQARKEGALFLGFINKSHTPECKGALHYPGVCACAPVCAIPSSCWADW